MVAARSAAQAPPQLTTHRGRERRPRTEVDAGRPAALGADLDRFPRQELGAAGLGLGPVGHQRRVRVEMPVVGAEVAPTISSPGA